MGEILIYIYVTAIILLLGGIVVGLYVPEEWIERIRKRREDR